MVMTHSHWYICKSQAINLNVMGFNAQHYMHKSGGHK
jgi:hypothetical protein